MTIYRGPGGTGESISDVDNTEFQTYVIQAVAAKDAAVAAQAAAELAENNAEAAENGVAADASAAASSASSAASSATDAATSASTASTQATNSSNSANSAANSATAADSSATSASASASTATIKASEASTSASNADISASTATTQASNAATSASNAATSATGANAAQTAAEAARDAALSAYDNFDDRYLGPKSSDPTLDNDGNALLAGALYFDTSTSVMRVYTGSVWVAAYVSAAGVLLTANNLSDLNNTATARANLNVPTRTGGDASGTWGIDVTGNAATVTDGVYTTGDQIIAGNKTLSSNPILSAGTANGVTYLNGSKVLTSGSALTFDGTSFGLGTASPSGASGRTFAINGGAGQARLALKNTSTGDAAGDGFQISLDNTAGGIEMRENLPLYFTTNNIERIRIAADGLVSVTGNTTLGDASTDTVQVNGYMGVGGAGQANVAFYLRNTAITGTQQYGVYSELVGNSAATTGVYGVISNTTTAAASFTVSTLAHFRAQTVTKGAGSTITDLIGVQVLDQTQGTNNYGITSAVSSGTNKWNVYASGTAQNYFAGNVGIGTSTPSNTLDVRTDDATTNAVTRSLSLSHTTTGTAANGIGSGIIFQQESTTGSLRTSAYIDSIFTDATDASLASALTFTTRSGGSLTEAMRLNASGNLGLGVTPSAWGSSYRAIDLHGGGSFFGAPGDANQVDLSANTYNDNTNFIYKATSFATLYRQNNGGHEWHTAPSGTAGATITFTQAMTLDASSNWVVGRTSSLSSSRATIQTSGTSAVGLAIRSLGGTERQLNITPNSTDGVIEYDGTGAASAGHAWLTLGTERARIDSSGNLLVGKTASASNTVGATIVSDGRVAATVGTSQIYALLANRQNDDGVLVSLRQADTQEGTISVSGTTVSYNGGHLARWAQTTTTKDESLVKGTVLSNLDEMNTYTDVDGNPVENEQLNKVKVSDVEGDANVAGVFVNWTYDDAHNVDEINMAMTGDMIIRIAQGTTVQRGDLLMSAGDGTAKPQGDDIVRSKTVAKVTSTHVTCTYADGSFCVPCVLMAC